MFHWCIYYAVISISEIYLLWVRFGMREILSETFHISSIDLYSYRKFIFHIIFSFCSTCHINMHIIIMYNVSTTIFTLHIWQIYNFIWLLGLFYLEFVPYLISSLNITIIFFYQIHHVLESYQEVVKYKQFIVVLVHMWHFNILFGLSFFVFIFL